MVNLDDYKPRDASKGYNWIKIRTSLIDDPKFMQLPDQAKSTYFELYLLAGKSDAGGLVLAGDGPATVQDIAWSLRKADADLQNTLDELQRAGLVGLDSDQVTVRKFASEQGPEASTQRKQWALRQAKRRALARGEDWTDPDAEQNQKSETEKNTETDQDQEQIKNQTKTKRVTHTSRDNHAVVTRDSIDDDVLTFGDDVLTIWNELKSSDYKPSKKYWQMIEYWQDAGVTRDHARQALVQTIDQAQTPLYVRELAVTLREQDPEIKNQNALEKFRQLYREQKQAGGDNGIHE